MNPTFWTWGLAGALTVALAGTCWRAARWLRRFVGRDSTRPSAWRRLAAAAKHGAGSLFSPRLPRLVATFFVDVLFQGRLLRRDPVRGVAHLAIFFGFMGLLLLHAMDELTVEPLASDYASTLNPWFWLRDLLGLLVLVGLLVGHLRRRAQRRTLPTPRRRDPAFVALLVAVLVSGFVLTAVKTASPRAFARMADEYAYGTDDELQALRLVWARDYGVAFDDLPAPTEELLATGREMNEDSCTFCHSRPQAAVVSYPVSRVLSPAIGALDAANAETVLLYLHVLLCFLGLAYLPLSRLFHVVADPVSLLARAGHGPQPAPENQATRRALALDACVRCGLCDERCSVQALSTLLDNHTVLPAEKLLATRWAATTAAPDPAGLERLALGAWVCTDCKRCTLGCPAGLNLAELWAAGKAELSERGYPSAAVWIRSGPSADWAERLAAAPQPAPAAPTTAEPVDPAEELAFLTRDPHTFSPCVQCQTCTSVCPVVEHSFDANERVDLTPQKIMNLLRLGLVDLAIGSRMVWDCVTCYQCQEQCPAGIRVTDVLYELRNLGFVRLAPLREGAPDSEGGAP